MCVCVCVFPGHTVCLAVCVFVRDDVMRGRLDISVCVSVWAVLELKAGISKNSLSDSVCVCVCVCVCECECVCMSVSVRETGHSQLL